MTCATLSVAHRPFTPRQQRENARFLAALRQTGNVRLVCRQLNVHRATYTKRRAKCAAFATEWDMVLAAAHAAFQLAGGERVPEAVGNTRQGIRSSRAKSRGARDDSVQSPFDFAQDERGLDSLRTRGGEPMVVRLPNGRLQLRRAPPGRMTEAARQRFLATVEETNNIRMAAAGAGGFAHTTLLARARRCPAFAGALAVQRRIGQDRVVWSLIDPARADPDSWEIADLPMPKTTVEQAMFQLIYHCPDGAFQRDRERRRSPPRGIACYAPRIRARIAAMKRADWHRETGSWRFPDE
jgi:hypothetical protein